MNISKKAVAKMHDREQWLALRSEKRGGGDLAIRADGKDSHDKLGEMYEPWSKYAGPDGKGPEPKKDPIGHYGRQFKRMIYPALGIPQDLKRDDLEAMKLTQALRAISAIESGLADLLREAMAANELRDHIKKRYADYIKKMAEPFRDAIRLERGILEKAA